MNGLEIVVFLADISDRSWDGDLLTTLNAILIVMKRLIALFGSCIILVGAFYAIFQFFLKIGKIPSKHKMINFDLIRLDLVKTIILGLEFIIAADVIETITAPDYYSLGIVAFVVLIRTFLNYSLGKDLTSLNQQTAEKNRLP